MTRAGTPGLIPGFMGPPRPTRSTPQGRELLWIVASAFSSARKRFRASRSFARSIDASFDPPASCSGTGNRPSSRSVSPVCYLARAPPPGGEVDRLVHQDDLPGELAPPASKSSSFASLAMITVPRTGPAVPGVYALGRAESGSWCGFSMWTAERLKDQPRPKG